jgi:hypothetical protein
MGWRLLTQQGVDVAHGRPYIVSHWGLLSWPAVRVFKSPRRPWSGIYKARHFISAMSTMRLPVPPTMEPCSWSDSKENYIPRWDSFCSSYTRSENRGAPLWCQGPAPAKASNKGMGAPSASDRPGSAVAISYTGTGGNNFA